MYKYSIIYKYRAKSTEFTSDKEVLGYYRKYTISQENLCFLPEYILNQVLDLNFFLFF